MNIRGILVMNSIITNGIKNVFVNNKIKKNY